MLRKAKSRARTRAALLTQARPFSIAYFALFAAAVSRALLAAAVSRASTVCRARNSGGGLEMNSPDAALVKRLNREIADGRVAGFEPSPERLRIRDGTMALACGPAVESAAEITAEDADIVGSAIRTE